MNNTSKINDGRKDRKNKDRKKGGGDEGATPKEGERVIRGTKKGVIVVGSNNTVYVGKRRDCEYKDQEIQIATVNVE